MVRSTNRERQGKRIVTNLLLVITLFNLYLATSWAQDKILIIISSKEPIYSEYARLLNKHFTESVSSPLTARIATLEQLDTEVHANEFSVVITAGPPAAEHVLGQHPETSLLLTLITSQDYYADKNGRYRCTAKNCSFLFLDQPPERQFRLLRGLFPDRKAVGIFSSHRSENLFAEYQRLAKQQKLKLVPIPVHSSEQVIEALQENIQRIEMLLSAPDPQIFNQNTAKGILLTTYYNKVPLLAYSTSFVKSGATAGIYSSLDDLAKHAAETASSLINQQATNQHIAYPKYYQIEINDKVSSSLNLDIPSAEKLLKILKDGENK